MGSTIRLLLGHLDLWTALVAVLIGVLKSREHWSRGRWGDNPDQRRLLGDGDLWHLWLLSASAVRQLHRHPIGWPNSPF